MSGRPSAAGIACGLAAYGIWGFFPLYFHQLAAVPPLDVLTHRALWACLFVALLLTLTGGWPKVRSVLATPGQPGRLALAALLVGSNWLIFLWAVGRQQVIESSLGYFLTPLVNVLLGLVVLKERLSRHEGIAVGLAVAAIAHEVFVLGTLPWVSLALAATFGTYGLVRKQVPVEALPGLWLETLVMLPPCLLHVLWQAQQGHAVFALGAGSTVSAAEQGFLLGAGVVTAVPLLFFAAATRRLDLATVGMLMYINPTLQFLTAVVLFDEPLQPARLFSFGMIWLGLAFFSVGLWQKTRRPRS